MRQFTYYLPKVVASVSRGPILFDMPRVIYSDPSSIMADILVPIPSLILQLLPPFQHFLFAWDIHALVLERRPDVSKRFVTFLYHLYLWG